MLLSMIIFYPIVYMGKCVFNETDTYHHLNLTESQQIYNNHTDL